VLLLLLLLQQPVLGRGMDTDYLVMEQFALELAPSSSSAVGGGIEGRTMEAVLRVACISEDTGAVSTGVELKGGRIKRNCWSHLAMSLTVSALSQ
jgi:hypothetical protein